MNLNIDLDIQQLTTGAGTRNPVSSLAFKRGDSATLSVRFFRAGVQVELASGASGKFVLKESGKYDADAVVAATAWVKTGTGTTTVYTFTPSFATAELNTLLNHGDANSANDIPSVTLMGEIEWTESGNVYSTQTFSAVVANDVVKGSESVPPPVGGGAAVNGVAATGVLTITGNFVAGETVTIGGVTYEFVAVLAGANTILIDADPEISLVNLEAAIREGVTGPTAGVIGAGTLPHPTVTTGVYDDTYINLVARTVGAAGNSISTAEDAALASFAAATLAGGVDFTPGFLGSMRVTSTHLYVVNSVTSGVPNWRRIDLVAF